jgi:thiamine biosynthesis lipoprotein
MATSNLTTSSRGTPSASVYLCCLFCVLLSFAGSAAAKQKSPGAMRVEFSQSALGATFRIVVYCPNQIAAAEAQDVVGKRLAQLEEILDATRESSELSQVYANANAGRGALRVSDDLFSLVRQADRFSGRSNGGYDVTAGTLSELWQNSFEAGHLPTQEQIDAAKALVGRKKLRLDPINRTIHLAEPGVRLDLQGLLESHVCDLLLTELRQAKLPAALVESSGSIALGDVPPGRKGWKIQMDDAEPKSPNRFVLLARQAIASSSHLADRVTIDDAGYSKLLFPPAGVGSRNLAPTTVVAPRALQAAVLARITSVNGETAGQKLIASMPATRVWYHYPPGERPQTQPAAAKSRGQQPQTMPFQWKTREIRHEGAIRQ